MENFDEREVKEKLEKLDELIELIVELRKGYLRSLYPELTEEEINQKIIEWKTKRIP